MRKVIACMNMTLDGYCDHTAMIADDELHQHYNEILRNADTLLYGRITYQLMEAYWPAVVKTPTGVRSEDEFAVLIDNISKIVYSRSLANVEWENTTLKKEISAEDILKLKQQAGKNILVGSPGLIATFTQMNLIDEYRLCIHPVIAGSGLVLFKDITNKILLKLTLTKTLQSGVVALHYERPDSGGK